MSKHFTVGAIIIVCLMLACAPAPLAQGQGKSYAPLAQKLQVGKSTEAEVTSLLGKPEAEGKRKPPPGSDKPMKTLLYGMRVKNPQAKPPFNPEDVTFEVVIVVDHLGTVRDVWITP